MGYRRIIRPDARGCRRGDSKGFRIMPVRDQHAKDIAKAAPKIAAVIRSVLADQRTALITEARAATGLTQADETTKLSDALKAAVGVATVIGVTRVAGALGTDVSDDDEDAATDLAGAMAYKFAAQFTSTSLSQL